MTVDEAMKVVQAEVMDCLPKIADVHKILGFFNRDIITVDYGLMFSVGGDVPKVKVNVHNTETDTKVHLDFFEFSTCHGVLKQEAGKLHAAFVAGSDYTLDEESEPVRGRAHHYMHTVSCVLHSV
jgi:hypothetical protein